MPKPTHFGQRWNDIVLDDGDGHLRRVTVPSPGLELAVGLIGSIARYELHGMDGDGRLVYRLVGASTVVN